MALKNAFDLPNLDNLLKHHGIDSEKVVIVSIIGKSSLNTSGLKIKSIGRLFPLNERPNKTCIKGSYDEKHQIVYLHLFSLLDADVLVESMGGFDDDNEVPEDFDFLSMYDEIKDTFSRHLLFLFYVSHIIILSHPGSTFDTSYIQYFKALDLLSKKLFDKICNSLKSLDKLNSDWVANGRPCTPRMLFYFERSNTKNKNLIKKLEHNMEDKIYHILKKTRIITTTGCSLFAIPLNDEFVYVDESAPKDELTEAVRGLLQDCQPGVSTQVQAPFSTEPSSEKDFVKFLLVHVQQAKNKGFNDTASSSRHQHAPAHFELPILGHWIAASQCLYSLIIEEETPITSLHTDTRFSEQRCLKVLPLAVAKYQEGLPPHYAKAEHEARLAVALNLFRTQARGPKYAQYELQLEVECQAHWENGRQQCEAASMTGNPCKLPKHAPDQEHISGIIYKSACDCGRKIGNRDDPYTVMQANYQFYQQMATKECHCSKLERIEFPIFEPSIEEFKAATIQETEEAISVLTDKSAQLSLEVDKGLVRQPSTTEYLPGMLTLNSPPGLLPVFPSWSLTCLGASSIYSHNLGLSDSYHPGFLSSTNYLLPWDVAVGSKSQKAWPAIGKYTNRGRRGRSTSTSLPQTVKVFIGVEYECSSGHRFMLSAPDRMLKAAPGSIVKETGHKIAESDVPLYFLCTCRPGKMAQLMRLHVVTPKASVYCTLNPKVQPGAGAPIFISTSDGPIKLTQSSYWVMRLPFAYVADKEHFKQNLTGKLLQGTFGVVEAE
ncbi:unnamed protein product [Ceutorhynchus assimilis]|uniref:Nonsense-mediated mRNA decay factor SMG8 n=1 Tax=Ceutorhynchus assimilis TaxID=467358 RepID=A0A9N9QI06_9CUCU|nr:unnamed protein product [Ceutorhynchus assimilis]